MLYLFLFFIYDITYVINLTILTLWQKNMTQQEQGKYNFGKNRYENYLNSSRSYTRKFIMTGLKFEVYDYQNAMGGKKTTRKNYKKRSKEEILENLCSSKAEIIISSSVRRTRSNITRLIDSNEDLKVFVTLTFEKNVTDLAIANKYFKKFIMRLKYQIPNLKYVCVPEFQERGAVHYHLLTNFNMMSSHLQKIWAVGYVNIQNIKHVENIGFYISKYIGKDLFDLRYFGQRKILYSKNLKRPLIITGILKVKSYVDFFLSSVLPVYENSYMSKWAGKISYKLYKLKYQNVCLTG